MGELRAADPVDAGERPVNAKAAAVLTHHAGVTPGTTPLITADTDEFTLRDTKELNYNN